ncbi:hypothetical protein AGMMS50239_06300 [Bacteroidia bacterium]|nr:hypothetical protein AGMMS50239_06300 [Bacteroidia bacterium]
MGQDNIYVYNYNTPDNPKYINSGIPNGVNIWTTNNTILTVHTHPFGTNSAPSPSDAIFLVKNYKNGSINIKANVAFGADGSEYMVYVDNASTFAAFCNNPSYSSFIENDGAYFKQGSIWRTEYDNAYNRMVEQGYSVNDAQSYALTYALRNTGLKVYQKKTGAFKEQKTELSQNNYSAKICP